jgi:ribosomal protein S18 acetylase RimI-like enzyme
LKPTACFVRSVATVSELAFRTPHGADAHAIACLHVESWRQSYRGIYSDSFLDGDPLPERIAAWKQRLSAPGDGEFIIVAQRDNAIVGFVYVIPDVGSTNGASIQNIHVSPGLRQQGVGSRLLEEAAKVLISRRPSAALSVWVRTDNAPALAFYEALGGHRADEKLGGPFADGSRAPVVRYEWPEPSAFFALG